MNVIRRENDDGAKNHKIISYKFHFHLLGLKSRKDN